MSKAHRQYIHRDVILSTILTFMILWMLKVVFINTKYLDPIYQALSDFQFTDIYFSQYQNKQTQIDTNIVIVNIGNNDRAQLAKELETIKSFHPQVIGLDATFPALKDPATDSALKAALHGPIPIILTKNILYDDEGERHHDSNSKLAIEHSNPYFDKDSDEGFGNFLAEDGQSVRYFTPFIQVGKEKETAFTVKVLAAFDHAAYQKLLKRGHATEVINYHTNAIPKIDVGQVDSSTDLSFLRGKIVLMGFMGPDFSQKVFDDNHVTPLNKSYGGHSEPDMYGVEIQANIISMALRRDYITEVPDWLTLIIAFLVCALHMYLFIHLYVEHHRWFHLGSKAFQLASFAFFLFLSIMLFHLLKLKLEPTYILVGVLLSCDALYFYEGLAEFLQDKFNFQSYFKKDDHH
jgi:CHASE2 domain-containing sensor protein